jgi:hypothetical protein
MLQVICDCGRIAEVRHRKNGKKLAYTHCTNCGGSVCNAAKAASIEASARENIGIKGEFFKISTDNVQASENIVSKDFKPEPEEMPEIVEPDINKPDEVNPPESEKKPSGGLTGLKIVAGLIVTSVLGITIFKVNQG